MESTRGEAKRRSQSAAR
jgi:hypothetical protein